MCLKQKGSSGVGVIAEINTPLKKEDIKKIFEDHNKKLEQRGELPELSKLEFIKNDPQEINIFLKNYSEKITKTLTAILKKTAS